MGYFTDEGFPSFKAGNFWPVSVVTGCWYCISCHIDSLVIYPANFDEIPSLYTIQVVQLIVWLSIYILSKINDHL